MATPTTHLSAKDTHVLSLLSLPTPPSAPPSPSPTPSASDLLAHRESTILAPLNSPSPSPSTLQEAISALSALITAHPSYASAYNNRAQATRMLHGDDLYSPSLQATGTWNDLNTAITLAEGQSESTEPASAKSVLAAAYTQRAWLVWKAAKAETPVLTEVSEGGQGQEGKAELPVEIRGLDRRGLEEWAARDFELGGRYGNGMAKEMARATNPYARLCGAIVGEVMRREMGGGKDEVGPMDV